MANRQNYTEKPHCHDALPKGQLQSPSFEESIDSGRRGHFPQTATPSSGADRGRRRPDVLERMRADAARQERAGVILSQNEFASIDQHQRMARASCSRLEKVPSPLCTLTMLRPPRPVAKGEQLGIHQRALSLHQGLSPCAPSQGKDAPVVCLHQSFDLFHVSSSQALAFSRICVQNVTCQVKSV